MIEDTMTNKVQLVGTEARSAINTILGHPSRNLICTGHEDGSIKVFDFTANKMT